jgi:hypothetical protein
MDAMNKVTDLIDFDDIILFRHDTGLGINTMSIEEDKDGEISH